jgi:hypothetical protein
MANYVCCECGTQYAESGAPPPACPICEDERQAVRWSGQAWTTMDDVRLKHDVLIRSEGERITGIGLEPSFAIGQRALFVTSPDGNILWDCVAAIDKAAIEFIGLRGGLKAIAISHPHYYTAMVEWSDALGGVPIYLHADDRQWVQRPHPVIVYWTGETMQLTASATLIRCGGHFEGGAVLHWSQDERGAGSLLSGDILQVTQDRRHVSFMRSYPNFIPLNAVAVRRIAAALAPFAFDSIYGAWWGRNILGGAQQAVDRSVQRYLAAIA